MSELLTKGIEVEMYSADENCYVPPISNKLKENLPFISQEPDERNFEYITNPTTSYEILEREIIIPRIKIR